MLELDGTWLDAATVRHDCAKSFPRRRARVDWRSDGRSTRCEHDEQCDQQQLDQSEHETVVDGGHGRAVFHGKILLSAASVDGLCLRSRWF
jgi:hypothetical protein